MGHLHSYWENIELGDRKEQVEKSKTSGGYRDWEAGAPHDPNHKAVSEATAAVPRRRRIDVSLWHLIALFCSVVFLGTIIVALIVVIATCSNSVAQSSSLAILLAFNASTNSTGIVTPNESMHFTTDMTTTTIDTSTTSTSTTIVTRSSSMPTNTSIVVITAPTVTTVKVVESTQMVGATVK